MDIVIKLSPTRGADGFKATIDISPVKESQNENTTAASSGSTAEAASSDTSTANSTAEITLPPEGSELAPKRVQSLFKNLRKPVNV
jgi:hypothetical protein